MPQKTLNVALAVVGAFLVTAFLLLGIDAWRSARTGPKWKRRLVGAGLALLTALGLPGCGGGEGGRNRMLRAQAHTDGRERERTP